MNECSNCHLLGHISCNKTIPQFNCVLCHKPGHEATDSLCPRKCSVIRRSCKYNNRLADKPSNSINAWEMFTGQSRKFCSAVGCTYNAQYAIHSILDNESFYRLVPLCEYHSKNNEGIRLTSASLYPELCNSRRHIGK